MIVVGTQEFSGKFTFIKTFSLSGPHGLRSQRRRHFIHTFGEAESRSSDSPTSSLTVVSPTCQTLGLYKPKYLDTLLVPSKPQSRSFPCPADSIHSTVRRHVPVGQGYGWGSRVDYGGSVRQVRPKIWSPEKKPRHQQPQSPTTPLPPP